VSTLFIADPGLRSVSGHHPAAVTTLSKLRGFSRLVFFGHAQPDAGLADWLASQGAQFKPHFQKYLYEAYRKPWSLAEAQPYVRELAQDYASLFSEAKGDGPLHVLHHTLDWPHLSALALALGRAGPGAPTVTHHVFLMFNPGIDSGGQMWDTKRQLSYKTTLAALARFPNVRFYTCGLELLEIYSNHFGLAGRIGPHPVFHFDVSVWRHAARNELALASNAPILLYVGDAKEAKGFLQLPALVSALLEHSRHHLCVQVGVDDRLRSAAIETALQELRKISSNSSRFELIERYVSESELCQLFLKSRCLVFNYSAKHYAHQTSGLLWQAAAAEIPVAVVGESWVSREAKRVCNPAAFFGDLKSLVLWLCQGMQQSAFEKPRSGLEGYRSVLLSPLTPEFFEQKRFVESSFNAKGRVLFIDAKLPDPQSSAGGHSAMQEMALFQSLGFQVRLFSLGKSAADPLLCAQLNLAGIEVHIAGADLEASLGQVLADCDLVFITRFNVAERVISQVRARLPKAKLLLNLADFHGLRLGREAQVLGGAQATEHARQVLGRELAVMSKVDLVLSYSSDEIALIKKQTGFAGEIDQLPWVQTQPDSFSHIPFESRQDIVFLGGFLHSPNTDAVLWFAKHVMPLVRDSLPEVSLRIYGSNMPQTVRDLQGPNIVVHGFAEYLSQVFDSARLFIAPLRFGAGIKGKVVSAMTHGVPTLCSPVAAEGIGAAESGLVICESAQDWAKEISSIYTEKARWQSLSEQVLAFARQHYSFQAGQAQLKSVLAKIGV
jgi:glycosyltransferase involved in cell wall biosynthesis